MDGGRGGEARMMARARSFRFVIVLVQVLAASFVATGASATRPALPVHAGPPPSAVSEFQPSVQYGGRTVSIDINPSNPSAAISATESGGLFTTSDAGANWQHVGSLPVFRMSEVRYSPDNPAIILATAWADDHVAKHLSAQHMGHRLRQGHQRRLRRPRLRSGGQP